MRLCRLPGGRISAVSFASKYRFTRDFSALPSISTPSVRKSPWMRCCSRVQRNRGRYECVPKWMDEAGVIQLLLFTERGYSCPLSPIPSSLSEPTLVALNEVWIFPKKFGRNGVKVSITQREMMPNAEGFLLSFSSGWNRHTFHSYSPYQSVGMYQLIVSCPKTECWDLGLPYGIDFLRHL